MLMKKYQKYFKHCVYLGLGKKIIKDQPFHMKYIRLLERHKEIPAL